MESEALGEFQLWERNVMPLREALGKINDGVVELKDRGKLLVLLF